MHADQQLEASPNEYIGDAEAQSFPTPTPLNVLIVEDSLSDAELVLAELQRAGFEPKWTRVETEPDFLSELKNSPDIILSDYSMPQFSGVRAAELLRAMDLNIPFILISGTLGEDIAVEAMHLGATDYVLKSRLARLGNAVKRALREARERRELKLTAATIRRGRAELKDLFDNAPVGYHEVDAEGRLCHINKTELNMLGYSIEEELLGQFVWKISADKEKSRLAVLAKLGGEPPPQKSFERLLRRKDGSTFPVLINDRLLKNKEGAVIGIRGTIQDITEYRKAESSLQEEQAMFRNLADSIPDKIYFKDRESRFIRINEALARRFGLRNAAEASGKTDYDFLDKEHARQAYEDEQEIMRTGLPMIAKEEREVWNDGRTTWASSTKLPMRDNAGKIIGIMGISRDITEHKQAEDEAHWKTALLEAQLNSSPDGILVVDNDGKKIIQNQRLNDLWAIPRNIVENSDDAAQVQFVTSRTKNPQQFADKVAYLYSHPEEVSHDEIELVDGTVLDRYSSPVRDKSGKLYGRIWAFHDITSRRKLEEQFLQAQKMEAIGQLAGGVAHDFNNILAVILMQADLLKVTHGITPEQLDFAKEIGAAAQRASALTRQLLMFSRKGNAHARDLDLNDSINDMTKMLRRTLGENIELKFKFFIEPLFVHADAGMMDQVLMNLAINSRDAMPEGGELIIMTSAAAFDESIRAHSATARPGSFVCLSVSDTGCGIPPENLQRIFEPFFTTKDVGKGTGLGLATVYGIVQQHKGWINAYSEAGRGTTFRIYLPRLEETPRQKIEQPTLAAMRGGDETILLVEDDLYLRASVHKALSQLGYHVLDAYNGVEALDVWSQHRDEIKLLLTDLIMPGGINGIELAGQLLETDPALKVIYASGYSAEIAGKDFSFVEGVNYITKPFEAHKLAQMVRQQLDAKPDANSPPPVT